MCIAVLPSEKNTLVMSRDDSSVSGSSAPPYTDPDPPYTASKPPPPPTQNTKKQVLLPSSVTTATNDSSTVGLPSEANNVPPSPGDIVEITVQDEQPQTSKEENALSAFAITSVHPAEHEDLESSIAHPRLPASTDDSITLQATVTSRGDSSEEDSISLSEEQKVLASGGSGSSVIKEGAAQPDAISNSSNSSNAQKTNSSAQNEPSTVVDLPPSSNSMVPLSSVPSVALASTDSVSSTDDPSSRTAQSLAAASSSSISATVSAGSGNGPSVQPGASRFRKINNYIRGRWVIRDTTAPEEHRTDGSGCDSKAPSSSVAGSGRSSNPQDIPLMGSASPVVGHRRMANDLLSDALHTRSTSDLGSLAVGGSSLGAGLGIMMTSSPCVATSDSDKDSHVDRSSTAADTLSRNTSLSSIPPMEKSIDGDDHLREFETESVASAPGSVPSRDTPEYPSSSSITLSNPSTPSLSHHPTAASTASSSSTAVSASTAAQPSQSSAQQAAAAAVPQSHGPSCACEVCASSQDTTKLAEKEPPRVRSVRTAMSQLQSKLEELLPELATSSKEENEQLHRDNRTLRELNSLLREKIAHLSSDVRLLKNALEQQSVLLPAGLSEHSAEALPSHTASGHGL